MMPGVKLETFHSPGDFLNNEMLVKHLINLVSCNNFAILKQTG
jgi:hypothetical protein